jgi:sugar lactone lactonase YvrE
MKTWLAVILLTLIASVQSFAMDGQHVRELNKQARELSKQKDWKGLLDVFNQLTQEMGTPTPIHMLRVASVETRLGHSQEALHWMQRYAATGLTYDIATDDDLKPLLTEKDFAAIAAEMKERSAAITKAEILCSLPIADLMPEDLTYEKASKTFMVSSVQHHTAFRVSLPKKGEQECALQELALDASAKQWPIFAISGDPDRHVLWMTSAAVPDFKEVAKADEGKTALLAIDSANGKVVRRFDLGPDGKPVLGDMTVAADGAVYVTDSVGGGVYRVRGDLSTAKLEKIADGLFSPQTPALAKDGKRLLVADYSFGVAIIDLGSGKVDYLRHPENIAVTGLDGLYLVGDSLLGVQNGTEPERIMRYRLNAAQTEIIGQEVIEQGPRIGDPTHVIVVDGIAYVSTNVGWGKIDDHGNLKAGEHFSAPVLMRFPVK